jgi:type IV secretory pathway protease TraF
LTAIEFAAASYFIMADNRGDPADSRSWGPIPAARIIGQGSAKALWRIGLFQRALAPGRAAPQ